MEQRKPWEQREDESAKAYRAFTIYRDLDADRTLDEASRLYYSGGDEVDADRTQNGLRAAGGIREWAAKHDWKERALAWDRHLDRKRREGREAAVRDMAKRQMREGKALQMKAIERLAKLSPDELSVSDVVRCLVEGAKLERLALGEPTENIQQRGVQEQYLSMSDPELIEMLVEEKAKRLEKERRLAAGEETDEGEYC